MADYTLSYSSNAQGWPSFYSFEPEYMRGMNSFFYTWKDGDMYRHNTNAIRNNYYGVQYSSTMQSVINDSPQNIKLFKTMSLEGDRSWECTALSTNLSVGSMLDTYFEEKEGEWFTFIRSNIGTKDFRLRSTNGIGQCTQVVGSGVSLQLFFTVPLGDILSVGDYAYSTAIDVATGVATGTSLYVGQVVAVDKAGGFIQVNMTVFEPSDNPPGRFRVSRSKRILFILHFEKRGHHPYGIICCWGRCYAKLSVKLLYLWGNEINYSST